MLPFSTSTIEKVAKTSNGMFEAVTAVVFWGILLISGQSYAQTVFKCRDANGNITYSSEPCAANSAQNVISVRENAIDHSGMRKSIRRESAEGKTREEYSRGETSATFSSPKNRVTPECERAKKELADAQKTTNGGGFDARFETAVNVKNLARSVDALCGSSRAADQDGYVRGPGGRRITGRACANEYDSGCVEGRGSGGKYYSRYCEFNKSDVDCYRE